ncbi:MAG TPA: Calx-beta domain-containing protein, partial [Chitinophagales bacterium]
MNKRVFSYAFSLIFFLLFADKISAQAAFYFSPTSDTATEGNGTVLIGYLISNEVSESTKNYTISYKSGTADTTDIGNFSGMSISLAPNTDSFPVYISITDDYNVEFTEYANLVIRGATENDTVGTDSIFTLYIKDNELPATIGFTLSVDTTWESLLQKYIYVNCFNPNPTPVSCYIYVDDSVSTLTENGVDFWYTWRTLVFPPGTSTQSSYLNIINDNLIEPTEYAIFKLSE